MISVCCCNSSMFDQKPKLIDSLDISNLSYDIDKILIYKSESNATTNESIQLRVKENKEEKVIKYFERYDLIIGKKLEGNTLNLILQDTSGYKNRIDTVVFNLDELKK